MPSRKSLPDDLRRESLCRALKKLGFEISTRGGNGSHIKATCTRSQKSMTIPNDLRRDVLHYVLKDLQRIGGVTWKDIKENL